MRQTKTRTAVFAEKIEAHGRTPLSAVLAPILGDIYVRAARMRGEKAVQLVWADGEEPWRAGLARALRAFLVADDGLFVEVEPKFRLRPTNWRDDLTPGFRTPSFREDEEPGNDPSRAFGLLAEWCDRAGESAEEWISSPDSGFVLPLFKGEVARGAMKPWGDAFAKAAIPGVPRPLPLGHLRPVPARQCADGLFKIDLMSGGIRARNYLEHLDPQWLRFDVASWFRAFDRDWDLDAETFLRRGRLLVRRLAQPASRAMAALVRHFGGRLSSPGENAGELLSSVRSKADACIRAYSEWRFADAVKEAMTIAGSGCVFSMTCAPWNRDADASVQADCSAHLAAFRTAAICLAPVLPDFAARVARAFGETEYSFDDVERLPETCVAAPWSALLPDLDPESFLGMVDDALAEVPAMPIERTRDRRIFTLSFK